MRKAIFSIFMWSNKKNKKHEKFIILVGFFYNASWIKKTNLWLVFIHFSLPFSPSHSLFPTSFFPDSRLLRFFSTEKREKICFSASYLNRLLLQFLNFFPLSFSHTRERKRGKKRKAPHHADILVPKLAENLTVEWIHKEPLGKKGKANVSKYYSQFDRLFVIYLKFFHRIFFPFQTIFLRSKATQVCVLLGTITMRVWSFFLYLYLLLN